MKAELAVEGLMKILGDNRRNHRSEFEKALEGYRKMCIMTLNEEIDRIKSGVPFKMFFHLPLPEDHTKDYDTVLGMLGMSVDETITLTEREYSCYVEDEWGWKTDFTTTNSQYK